MDDSTPAGSYAVVMIGFLFQLLAQLALQLLLAGMFGASRSMDAYLFAMGLPVSLSAILAGTLGPPLITLLGSEPTASGKSSLAGLVLWGASAFALLLAAGGMVISIPLMHLLQPGLDAAKTEETARLFRVLVWLVPANTLIGLLQSVLNAALNFRVPAIAGVAGPLVTVLMVWQWGAAGIDAVAWATVGGAAVNVLVQLAAVRRQVAAPTSTEMRERIRSVMALAGPILAGMMFLKVDPLFDRYVTSDLDDGRMAQLQFAYRVLTIFLMLASGTLSTVSFPRIARRTGEGREGLVEELGSGLVMLVTLCLPALAAMTFFAQPIVKDLFERGQFTAEDTAVVARLLQIYAPMLVGAALGELCGKTLYALRDTVTPNVVGPAFLLVGFVLKLLLVSHGGVLALAGITSAMWVLAGLALLAAAVRRVGRQALQSAAGAVVTCSISTAAAMGVGAGVLQLGTPLPGLSGLLAGSAVYFGMMGLLSRQFRGTVASFFQQR